MAFEIKFVVFIFSSLCNLNSPDLLLTLLFLVEFVDRFKSHSAGYVGKFLAGEEI